MKKKKTVNSLSSGKSSSLMAAKNPADYDVFSLVCINRLQAKPKDAAITNYVNEKLSAYVSEFGEFIASLEDDLSLKALMDLEQYIGREITWVRGMSFDEVIDSGTQTRLPSWARRYCTEKMKLLPIFLWWFRVIGEPCNMRIGFRFDEMDRMFRFFNYTSVGEFKVPVSCKLYGQRRQVHQIFRWRFVEFPLIKNALTKQQVEEYWNNYG